MSDYTLKKIYPLPFNENYDKMAGISYMICKPYSRITSEWYNSLINLMDDLLPELEKHPAVFSREANDRDPSHWYGDEKDERKLKLTIPQEKTKYPIAWAQILAEIFHPIQYKYYKKMGCSEEHPIIFSKFKKF